MAKHEILAELWRSFAQDAIPDAEADQYDSMRIAFYIGALSAIDLTDRMTKPGVSEEKATRILTDVRAELMQFCADPMSERRDQ